MIIIAIMNQKGGVAKTTTAINLGAQAALKNKTLLIDADSQANLSSNFNIINPDTTIKNAFLGEDYAVQNVSKNLDVLPCSIDFTGIDLKIQNEFSRELLLKNALSKLSNSYKYVFIDCPPDISLVTVNALAASNYVIIPVKAAMFSLNGIETMIDFITKVKTAINPDLSILGILLTQYSDRLKITKTIASLLNEKGWEKALFKTKIRRNTDLENSQIEKKTIFQYNRKSTGALDYKSLGEEILTKIKKLK